MNFCWVFLCIWGLSSPPPPLYTKKLECMDVVPKGQCILRDIFIFTLNISQELSSFGNSYCCQIAVQIIGS